MTFGYRTSRTGFEVCDPTTSPTSRTVHTNSVSLLSWQFFFGAAFIHLFGRNFFHVLIKCHCVSSSLRCAVIEFFFYLALAFLRRASEIPFLPNSRCCAEESIRQQNAEN